MNKPTVSSSEQYVSKLLYSWGYLSVNICKILPSEDTGLMGIDAYDVHFIATIDGINTCGMFTVWMQEDGSLYGEW